MTCENFSLSISVLHKAVEGGYEPVVYKIVKFVKQLPATEQPFLDSRGSYNKVIWYNNMYYLWK